MIYEKIATIVISAMVGGFITHLFDRAKERREEKKDRIAKIENQRKNRPELIITSMKGFNDYHETSTNNNSYVMEVLVTSIIKVNVNEGYVFAKYDDSILNSKLWTCREFVFKNVGNTVIQEINIVSQYKKDTCIFNTKSIDDVVLKHGILNYSVMLTKRIAPGECFTLKLCYNRGKVITGFLTAMFDICMRDDNGIYWAQPFFAPEDTLYESREMTYQEYKDAILPDKAIDCFLKPYLW